MRYLLDTNVCVVYLNDRSNAVRDRIGNQSVIIRLIGSGYLS